MIYIVIEKLKTEEIPELLELYKELVDFENTVKTSQEVYNQILKDDNYLLLTAKENDEIIGSVLGVCCNGLAVFGQPFMVVEDVIVKEEYRGKGVGKKLFNELEKFAEEKNCSYSILVSSGPRKNAHAFYEKLGYVDDVRGFRKNYF